MAVIRHVQSIVIAPSFYYCVQVTGAYPVTGRLWMPAPSLPAPFSPARIR